MKKVLLFLLAAALAVPAAFAQNDSDIQASVQKALSSSRFKGIQASVQGGVVTLNGNVDVVATKISADQKVHHVKGVTAVRNDIQVNSAAPRFPTSSCRRSCRRPSTTIWSATAPPPSTPSASRCTNGVVTLGGHAYGPVDASDAVAIVENTKGVRDVINNIQVDPVSPNGRPIRLAVFRAGL